MKTNQTIVADCLEQFVELCIELAVRGAAFRGDASTLTITILGV